MGAEGIVACPSVIDREPGCSKVTIGTANPLLNRCVHLTPSILFTSLFAVMTREQNHEYQQDYRNYLKYSGSSH